MKAIKTLLIVSTHLLFIISAQASKETLKQGWDAFNANKRSEARDLFTKAANDADTKADANLALALVWASDDKTDKAFAAFNDFYKASGDPYPYVYALWTSSAAFNGYGKKSEAHLKLVRTILDDPKANGTIKAMAHSMLGKHYEALGDFKKMEEEFAQIGTIDKWKVVGTFDNTSASGFNKDFGALANAKDDAIFKNKVNADVKWYEPPYVRSDRWFDFEYYFASGNSIMYAQTFVKSESDQDVYFRSGNSGSLKIWLNDKLVTEVSEERNCDMDIYINKVKLQKGFNRILVQIGESETGSANFMLRVTDAKGDPIKGLSTNTSYQAYTKAAEYTVGTEDLFAEDFFEAKVKADPNDLLSYVMLAEVYLRNDKAYEARKTMKKARALAPESTFMGIKMIEAYSRDKNVTDLTKEYEKIKTKDPESVTAMKGFIDEASDKEDYDEMEKLIEKYKKLYGADEYTDMLDLGIAAQRNKVEEIIRMTPGLYAKYPDNYSLMSLTYNIEKNTSKNVNRANQVLKNYLKNNYSDKVWTMLADNYYEQGQKGEALKIYLQRYQNYPYSISYAEDVSDVYMGMQDYNNALIWAEKAKLFAPYIGAYWSKTGKIYQAMNRTEDAKNEYRKAIYYTPTNYEARKQLRKLEDKKDLFENFEKTDAYDLFKKSPKAEDYPEDNSIILLNETQRVVYPEGATEEKAELLIKVFNKSGIDRWKEYSIGYNGYRQRLIIDKAEVFKKDGNKVQAEKNNSYIVFTDLEVGDAIHLSYRIENYNTGKLAQHFWEQFNFNFSYPSLISRYSILLPATKEFKYEVMNADIKAVEKPIEDMKMYVWEMKDQQSIKAEPYMPPLTDIGAVLDISTLPDWKYVSNWYSDLSTTLAKGDFEIKETVAEIFSHSSRNLTELQKVKAIYNYIEENVSYSSVSFMHGPIIPQKASRTLNTKLGDCKDVSTLLVAMCKEVGIKANLILVDTRDNGERHLNLPSIDFNHCIAELTADGKKYYVELTDQKLSFSSLPTGDINANILRIPRDGDAPATNIEKLNSANRPKNSTFRTTDLKFENNDFIFTRKNVKTGSYASGMRSDFGDEGKEQQEKSITRAVASEFTNPAKLTSLKFNDLVSLTDSVEYEYSFNVKNEVNEVVGIKIFRLPWSEAVRSLSFLSLETRKYPFLVWNYDPDEANVEIINVELPKGKLLAEQPKSVSISNNIAEYSLTYNTSTPGKLTATRILKFKKQHVSPAEYAEFRDFYNKVAEADTKQIGFK